MQLKVIIAAINCGIIDRIIYIFQFPILILLNKHHCHTVIPNVFHFNTDLIIAFAVHWRFDPVWAGIEFVVFGVVELFEVEFDELVVFKSYLLVHPFVAAVNLGADGSVEDVRGVEEGAVDEAFFGLTKHWQLLIRATFCRRITALPLTHSLTKLFILTKPFIWFETIETFISFIVFNLIICIKNVYIVFLVVFLLIYLI